MNKFVKAVLITTLLSVITRALGLFIKIYISREIGAEALGYFQISLSIFFVFCSLVTSGIPLIISRKIATNKEIKPKIVFSGLILSTSIAVLICLVVVLFPQIFTLIWGQNQSLPVLLSLLPALIFTAIYVPFRGAFWGNKNFFLLGFTELIEQAFRFVACFIFFNLSLSIKGENIAGITYSIACVLSSILAIILYFINGGKIKPNLNQIKPLFIESAPIAIMRIGSNIVSFLISLIFPAVLVKTGLNLNESVGVFGIITGMVLPLITIPGTLISSISVALIPEISGKSEQFTAHQINHALSYSIIISFLLLPSFIILGKPLGVFLFNNTLAGEMLQLSSILLIPLGITQISSSILNAINKEKLGLINYLAGATLMIISIIVLPQFIGIHSLIAGFFLMSLTSGLLNLIAINKYLDRKSLKTFLLSLLYSLPSSLLCLWSYNILSYYLPTFLSLIISGGLSLVVLIVLYQLTNMIDIKDYLPNRLKKV